MKITNKQLKNLIKEELDKLLKEKKWSDFGASKNELIRLTPQDWKDKDSSGNRDLDDEIFDLIQKAYADVPLGDGKFGNAKIQKPEDLPAGYTIMDAADIDDDPDPDYVYGGKMKNGNYKMAIFGYDGTKEAASKYLEETAELLKGGAICEMSGKLAHVMITRYKVPAVTSHEKVESMIGKKVKWVGRHKVEKFANRYGPEYEGWYEREIGGNVHMKILLGGG